MTHTLPPANFHLYAPDQLNLVIAVEIFGWKLVNAPGHGVVALHPDQYAQFAATNGKLIIADHIPQFCNSQEGEALLGLHMEHLGYRIEYRKDLKGEDLSGVRIYRGDQLLADEEGIRHPHWLHAVACVNAVYRARKLEEAQLINEAQPGRKP